MASRKALDHTCARERRMHRADTMGLPPRARNDIGSAMLASCPVLAARYLLGSIPFGLLLTRAAGLGDIRTIGSGNIGATNVLRTGNKTLAAATLLLDAAKGAVPVLIAGWFAGRDGVTWAGIGAVLGHAFPIWLGFRGGKAVATAYGVLIAAAWPVGIAAGAIWLATAALLRISSLASLVSFAIAANHLSGLAAQADVGRR